MGEQVAYNKCEHCNVELHTNDAGEYYPVVNRMDKHTNIRGEYIPIGNKIQFPKKWGRKEGATILLEQRIQDVRKQIEDAQLDLDKLQACLEKVQLWDSTEK